jgi:hypothetical protein
VGPQTEKALEIKREHPEMTRAELSRAMGVGKSAVSNWLKNVKGFEAAWNLIEYTHAQGQQQILGKSLLEPPDFLAWRVMHNAYLDRTTKKVKRAKNFPYQRQWINDMESANRLIMVIHPGAGKTTSISEYVTWNIMRDRNFRSMIIRANEDEATKNVAQIGTRLVCDNYHWMIERMEEQGDPPITCPVCLYGGRDGYATQSHGRNRKLDEQWSRGALTVSGRTSGDKEATVEAYGADTPIAGVRSDLIVLDDAQNPQKYRTTGAPHSDKMLGWFKEDVLGRLYDDQKVVIIGNRLGSADFVGRLIAEYGDYWKVVYYPAVLNADTKRVLVPELWTYDALMRKRKEVGEEIWAFQWQQQEINEADSTFVRDVVELCRDPDLALGDRGSATHVVLGIDPAIVNFCAMVVWGVNPESGVRTLIDFVNERGMKSEDNIAARAGELCAKYGVRTCVVETNNIQATVFNKVKSTVAPLGVRCVDYKTVTATGASAEAVDFDITSIATLFQERLVKLPYADVGDNQKRVREFIEQFLLWRPKPPGRSSWHLTRDLVMATLFAESEARKAVKRGEIKKSTKTNRAPAWAKNKTGGYIWQRPRQSA